MWDFPSPATTGQVFTPVAGVDYVFNGVAWEMPSAGALSLVSLLPAYMEAGGPNLTLRVKGVGFLPSSVIQFDGAAVSTTYGDSTELQTLVTATTETVRTVQVTVLTGTVASNPLPLNFVPVPTLTAIAPVSMSVAGPDVLVTATGTGFMPDSKGVCGGFELPTTYISATSLTATVQPTMGNAGQQVYFVVATGKVIQSNAQFFNFLA